MDDKITKLAELKAKRDTLISQAKAELTAAEQSKGEAYAALIEVMANGGDATAARKAYAAAEERLAAARLLQDVAEAKAAQLEPEIADLADEIRRVGYATRSRRDKALQAALATAEAEYLATFENLFFALRRCELIQSRLGLFATSTARLATVDPRGGPMRELYGQSYGAQLAELQNEVQQIGADE